MATKPRVRLIAFFFFFFLVSLCLSPSLPPPHNKKRTKKNKTHRDHVAALGKVPLDHELHRDERQEQPDRRLQPRVELRRRHGKDDEREQRRREDRHDGRDEVVLPEPLDDDDWVCFNILFLTRRRRRKKNMKKKTSACVRSEGVFFLIVFPERVKFSLVKKRGQKKAQLTDLDVDHLRVRAKRFRLRDDLFLVFRVRNERRDERRRVSRVRARLDLAPDLFLRGGDGRVDGSVVVRVISRILL